MARDSMSKRFSTKQNSKKLGDLAKKNLTTDEIDAEEELLKNTEKVKPIIKADKAVGRNEPCPCGSGKKFKKCCANKA